jgi:hypothetical protein
MILVAYFSIPFVHEEKYSACQIQFCFFRRSQRFRAQFNFSFLGEENSAEL